MHVDGHEIHVGASVGIAIDGNVLEPEVFFDSPDTSVGRDIKHTYVLHRDDRVAVER